VPARGPRRRHPLQTQARVFSLRAQSQGSNGLVRENIRAIPYTRHRCLPALDRFLLPLLGFSLRRSFRRALRLAFRRAFPRNEHLALDHSGALVYLAPTRVNLQLTLERWPGISFRETREHLAAAA
jgi:hypothetical protein